MARVRWEAKYYEDRIVLTVSKDGGDQAILTLGMDDLPLFVDFINAVYEDIKAHDEGRTHETATRPPADPPADQTDTD